MFSTTKVYQTILFRVLLLAFLSFSWALPAPAGALKIDSCTDTSALELNGIFRGYHEGDVDFFEVDIPTAGDLVIQAITPLTTAAEPRMAPWADGCQMVSSAVKNLVIIDTFATGFVIEIQEPGVYRFGVAAQDPHLTLGSYKVLTRFIVKNQLEGRSENKSTEDPDPDPDPLGFKSTVDPDPDPDPLGCTSTVDPDPDPDPLGFKGTVDPDPDPDPLGFKGIDGSKPELLGSKKLCLRNTGDDHGDVFPCASTLIPGSKLPGKLDGPWGDDRDLFTFVLSEWQTVEVEGSGESDFLMALYDGYGHRLSAHSDLLGKELRLVITLAPGRYFLAIEGATGTGGDYSLHLRPLIW